MTPASTVSLAPAPAAPRGKADAGRTPPTDAASPFASALGEAMAPQEPTKEDTDPAPGPEAAPQGQALQPPDPTKAQAQAVAPANPAGNLAGPGPDTPPGGASDGASDGACDATAATAARTGSLQGAGTGAAVNPFLAAASRNGGTALALAATSPGTTGITDAAGAPPPTSLAAADGPPFSALLAQADSTSASANAESPLGAVAPQMGNEFGIALVQAQASEATAPAALYRATLMSQPQHSAFPAELGAQVKFLMAAGLQQAELHLNPAELGPIHIQLHMTAQTADISFAAAHSATREGILQALPALRELLASQGLHLGQAGLGAGPGGQGFSPSGHSSHSSAPRRGTRGEAGGMAAGAVELSLQRPSAERMLDAYA